LDTEVTLAGEASPKISVIIPVFNGANYLREAIDSVLSQTYKNFEVIVVDDGSVDETWEIIQSYGPQLKGIHKANGGVASALNCGIQQATGKYIAWLSHDDLFLPNKLEHQMTFLQQFPQIKACYTDYYVIDTEGNIIAEIETPWYPREQAIRMLFVGGYVNGSTMVIERSCFDQVGLFSEKLRYTQDTEMWLRLSLQFEIGRVPEKLGKQRYHRAQGSRSIKIHRAESETMYRQVFEKLGIGGLFTELVKSANDPQMIARAYIRLGDVMATYHGGYAFADELYARAIALYPFWHNPARLKRFINRIRRISGPIRISVGQKVSKVLFRRFFLNRMFER
jgi:glycosyltransferase involved in cell wall biosynthesis